MVKEETYHLINEYLNGELKGRALDKFKSDLKTDKKLQKALASQEAIIDSIRTFREAELKSNLQANLTKSRTFVIGRSFKMALASAAVITLVVSAFFVLRPYMNSSKDTMTNEVDTSDQELPVLENTSPSDELTQVDTQTIAIAENTKSEELLDLAEELEAPTLEVVDDDSDIDEEKSEQDEIQTPEEARLKKAIPTATDAKDVNGDDAIQDYEVKSDMLLSNKKYRVVAISPNFSTVKETTASTAKRADSKAKETDKADSDKEEATRAAPTTTSIRSIEVEHWKSVVNYKGYNYDGTKVKLYGVSENTNLEFKELDNRLYVKIEGKQYFMERNKDYKRLVEVTNPALLNVLND